MALEFQSADGPFDGGWAVMARFQDDLRVVSEPLPGKCEFVRHQRTESGYRVIAVTEAAVYRLDPASQQWIELL